MAAATAIQISCQREALIEESSRPVVQEEIGQTVDFTIDTVQTKALCNGLKISFQEGDRISVNGKAYSVENVDGRLMIRKVACSADNSYACIFPADGDFLGTGDSNYKWSNVQFYQSNSFGREAMPLICHAVFDAPSAEMKLSFFPAMGMLVLPVSGQGAEIRCIKLENNDFNPKDGMSYMSGRMLPYNSEGVATDGITADSRYLGISSAVSTAESPYIVLLCNDADGKGVKVSGTRNFYVVLPPGTYSNGFKVTITDNAHKSRTFTTSGSTTVKPGQKITMQKLYYSPSSELYFSEHFDAMTCGSDPVGYRSGVTGYRGFLPRRDGTGQSGQFANSSNTGFESNYWYGATASPKDSGGQTVKEAAPGSDIYANWHTNATNDKDDVFTMSDINTAVMSASYIKSRGMWDWVLSRIVEYQGYILVGKSQAVTNAFPGMTSTGSPQGALKTPALTAISTLENVKLTFRIAKGFGSPDQSIRIACQGSGRFLKFSCGGLSTSISEDGRYAYIDDASSLSDNTWTEAVAFVAGASSITHFQFFSPDSEKGVKTTTYYLDDIEVCKSDVSDFETLTGQVSCNGSPVAGVIVSDGYTVTKTDSQGRYGIVPNSAAGFVFVSVPSGYEMVRNAGDILPGNFRKFDPSSPTTANFEMKQVSQGSYTLFVMSDSHVLGEVNTHSASDDDKQYRNIFIPSAKDFISKQSGPLYGIHLGDYSQCEWWGHYSLADYYNDTKTLDIPIFHTIGNHDHDYNNGAYGDSHSAFENVLGPRYYSFNIGTQHFIMLDDVHVVPGSTANSGYDTDFTPEQVSWLRQDVAAMPSGVTQVVLCTHCPILSLSGSAYNIDGTAGALLFSILKDYDVVCLTGHNHYDRCCKGVRNNHTVIDFVHPSLAGTAWFTDRSGDGTPRSAGVYRVIGSDITRSLYAFDSRTEVKPIVYNKGVDDKTGTKQLSEDDEKGTSPAILVNCPNAYSCEFTESTGGKGVTSNGVLYDLDFRHFFVTFSVKGKTLGNWQYPTSPRHIWQYIPADPSATITIKAKDIYGRDISREGGNYITTKIE